jgi:hypothetical protein
MGNAGIFPDYTVDVIMARLKDYMRLPGRRRLTAGFSRNSLWLGKDHLLHVINRGYTEDYRRFYYRDIQAILVRHTKSGLLITVILAILFVGSLLALVASWLAAWPEFVWIPLAGAALLWLLILVFHLIAGQTCVCHLRTAVQFEPLPSLFRVKTARKAIALLRQRVETEQGSFPTQAASS